MVILGLDSSTSVTGWAFCENGKVLDAGYIDTKNVFFCIFLYNVNIYYYMKQKDLKTIRIPIETYNILKNYCDKKGYKIYKIVSELIINNIK